MAAAAKPVPGPWLQAGRLAFIALYAVVIIAAIKWATNNLQQVPAASRAIVWRAGGISRVQGAGLLIAWPAPLERVTLIPSPETVLERKVPIATSTVASASPPPPRGDEANEDSATASTVSEDAQAGDGFLLTGDAGIVSLDITVFYAVSNPYEYALQTEHVIPALDRLVSRSAVVVTASRDLDTILVARPELLNAEAGVADQRERLRSDLVRTVNRSLDALAASGAGLGIHIVRVDVQSKLPSDAISAFDQVLTATQNADQAIAAARTEGAYTSQQGNEAADRTVQLAYAQASERISKAQSDTVGLLQLEDTLKAHTEPALMTRIYRERVKAVLKKAGPITLVNPKDDAHLILDGARP